MINILFLLLITVLFGSGDTGPFEHGPYEHFSNNVTDVINVTNVMGSHELTVVINNNSNYVAEPLETTKVSHTTEQPMYPLGKPVWDAVTDWDTGYCNNVSGFGWSTNMAWPTVNNVVKDVSIFGRYPAKWHRGIDIPLSVGDPVFAALPGKVVWAGYNTGGYGNLVILSHGPGYYTIYGHLHDVLVSCHESVGRGQMIALGGNSGNSSGPHLHFEVQYGGLAHDPLQFLSGYTIVHWEPGPEETKPTVEEIMERLKK